MHSADGPQKSRPCVAKGWMNVRPQLRKGSYEYGREPRFGASGSSVTEGSSRQRIDSDELRRV